MPDSCLSKPSLQRLKDLGISVDLLGRYIETFVCCHRHVKIGADGKRQPKHGEPEREYPIKSDEFSMVLSGKYWFQVCPHLPLMPWQFARRNQTYFVIRLLPDDRDDPLWVHRLSVIQRYAAIIDVLGVPGVVFSQRSCKELPASPRFIDTYYFLSQPETCDERRLKRASEIRVGNDLIHRLEELYRRKIPRLDFKSPINFPEQFPWYFELIDIEKWEVIRVDGPKPRGLHHAIEKSAGAANVNAPKSVTEYQYDRAGIIPRIEHLLLKSGLDVRETRIEVIPSLRTPADLPWSAGSQLLHPITLEPVMPDTGTAMKFLLETHHPVRIGPSSLKILAQKNNEGFGEYWRLKDDQAGGVLPALARREWDLGGGEPEILEKICTWHKHHLGRNPLFDAGIERRELKKLVHALYRVWGEPFDGEEPVDGKRCIWCIPDEKFEVPFAYVRTIHEMNGDEFWEPGKNSKGEPVRKRNFQKENQVFTAWRMFDHAEQAAHQNLSNARSEVMLHSECLDRIPGFKGTPIDPKLILLSEMGIDWYGEPNQAAHQTYKYTRRPESRPKNPSGDNRKVTSLEQGLWMLIEDEKKIRRLYSRRHAEAILATRPKRMRPRKLQKSE